MAIIHFSDKLIEKHPEIFDNVQNRLIDTILAYCIDWRTWKVATLKNWIKEQIDDPSSLLQEIAADKITTYKDPDQQALAVLKWVNFNISYTSDDKQYKIGEYWATANETLRSKEGDCEDGAILIYVLCRLKGIPANRLWIMAGDVQGGGHSWVAYKPKNYPLNPVFLDWCYWYNGATVANRSLFTIVNKDIIEHSGPKTIILSNYFKIWFAFNEDKSYTKIIPRK